MRTKEILSIRSLSLLCCLFLAGCAQGGFSMKSLGSGILSSTGVVSGSQADALFEAGEKIAKAASPLSDEQEYYLGRGVSAMVFAQYRPYRNAAVNQYVNRVGAVVAAVSDKPETFNGYHFQVLDTEEVNAISAPGGFVFVTKGFLRLMKNEDTLASVLAHEVAHINYGHGVSAISQANLTEALLILGKEAAASQAGAELGALTSAFGDSVTDVFNTLLTKGYSRSQEYESDEYAALLLKKAGYTPGSLQVMLTSLEQASKGSEESGWYSTHPSPSRRISNLPEFATAQDPAAQGLEVRTARFRKALASLS
ncbi:MAG: hypothetical protein DCC75_05610 [Proteobacteria bacterium]|nr:MAG: hypothetical protein DCC75_05610 [Pseudomonadota bacterium]